MNRHLYDTGGLIGPHYDSSMDTSGLYNTSGGDIQVHGCETRTYTRRWFMLAMFATYSFSNAFQWIHLNILDDVMTQYYNESLPEATFARSNALDWLAMVYLLSYTVLILPATWILDKKGLRFCCILGAFFNSLAALIKCAAVSGERFYVLMIAQVSGGIAQLWVVGIPARLSAVWFGPTELATATSIGVFGNQMGVAVGFLLPPEIVRSGGDNHQIGNELSIMFYSTAAVTTLIFLFILFGFQNEPPEPPSHAQMVAVRAAENTDYLTSLRSLVKNKGFMMLTLAYGLNTGVFYAVATLLNPIVLSYFPGQDADAGLVGLTLVLTGIFGALLAGVWVDKTGAYKSTTIAVYVMSLLSMTVLTATAHLGHIWVLYITAGMLGFFMTGYLPVGFEYAAELTFPESEGTSSGIIQLACQFFGMSFTLGLRAILTDVSALASNITTTAILLFATIITCFISSEYRRRKAAELPNIEVNIGSSAEDSDNVFPYSNNNT